MRPPPVKRKPKARLRGEKSLAFGPAHDIRRVPRPQGYLRTDWAGMGINPHGSGRIGSLRSATQVVQAEVQAERWPMSAHQVRATAVAVEAWKQLVGRVRVAKVQSCVDDLDLESVP